MVFLFEVSNDDIANIDCFSSVALMLPLNHDCLNPVELLPSFVD